MSDLIFKAEEVRRIVEHSLNAPAQEKGWEGKLPSAPAVILVHDQGVYLMSNGEPRDIVEGTRSFVAYAKFCDPFHDTDWWETARDLVGGDDFGEQLPWAGEIKAKIDAGAKTITIRFGEQSVELL